MGSGTSFREEQVPASQSARKVYNVNAIKVRECVKGIVGKPVTFLVETSHAGPGNLEVTVNNGQVMMMIIMMIMMMIMMMMTMCAPGGAL